MTDDEDDDDTGIHQNNIMCDSNQCCKSGFVYIREVSQICLSIKFMSSLGNMSYDIYFNYYSILFSFIIIAYNLLKYFFFFV